MNLLIKNGEGEQYKDQWKLHAAEHLIANRYRGKESMYSWGCSNSFILIWFIINFITIWFMPWYLSNLISMFIAGELIVYLYFHQNSFLANLIYPYIIDVQNWTLLKPESQHIKVAELTLDKLKELENEN